MNTLKHFLKETAIGLFLLANLAFALPAFAQVNTNPRLDNRNNPMPIARVANTEINSIADAPDFHQGRRPAIVLFYSLKGGDNQVNSTRAAMNMLALTSLEYLNEVDVYTVDNDLHPEIFAAYNQGQTSAITQPFWLRIVPPIAGHVLNVQTYDEAKSPIMTQAKLEYWLATAPNVTVAAIPFVAPELPYVVDKNTGSTTIKLPMLEADAVNPADPPGVTTIVVLFYPELGPTTRSVYRALTLSGIEAFRFAKKPMYFVAPSAVLTSLHLTYLTPVQAGEPQLVVARVDNKTGQVISAASYDPSTTFAGDATKVGTLTSELSEPDVEAYVAAACSVPLVDQHAYLSVARVADVMERAATRASIGKTSPAGDRASLTQTGPTQEASILKQ
jgi:hypothetical protein